MQKLSRTLLGHHPPGGLRDHAGDAGRHGRDQQPAHPELVRGETNMSTTLTPRQTFRETVALVAAKAHAKLPACRSRIDAAVRLVLLGEVTLLPDGTATVGSCTDPTKTYTVNGTCPCQDYERAPGQLCKHRLAYGIARRAAEMLPQAPPVEPEPVLLPAAPMALPEAPASANCHIILEGRQVQITLRDTDEGRLLTPKPSFAYELRWTEPGAERDLAP
jgi:hypothetical protein